jgi:hypothetical protein
MSYRSLKLSVIQILVGTIWAWWGMALAGRMGRAAPVWALPAIWVGTLILLLVVWSARGPSLAGDPLPLTAEQRRWYRRITSLEILGVIVAVVVSSNAGRDDLMLVLASWIVALHFFLLYPVFRAPAPGVARRFLITAAIITALAAAGWAWAAPAPRQEMVGVGMLAVMWITALLHLRTARA